MTCQECAEFLFEEMDVGEFNRAAVVHLSECEDCRSLARELRANGAALRSMRDDVVPSVLGSNVLPTCAVPRRSRHLYWLAAAAALVVAVGLGVTRMNQASKPEVVSSQVSQQAAAIARPDAAEALPAMARTTALSASEQRVRNRQEREPRPQRQLVRQMAKFERGAQPASPGSQAALKIVTADPNVVIYLLGADTNGEGNDEGKIL